ncbi:phosphotransferase [Celerinatantimonas diazotrophica]|uniref:Thiamine kinase-like enzyme n=1 Tax=Celerinatantimonas diazotrophica TaxID=412034 RepID=A0A4R1K2H6_9GAMM|nr:phosphotransferase [Celerinatantimonas diazotrophica]TCK58140.1 thiamine kinase-like enzyme [Celerinatantimonas diazotrophica]CAG9297788.1 Thiamine kinase [Celerinatantimonas diazotrophica]
MSTTSTDLLTQMSPGAIAWINQQIGPLLSAHPIEKGHHAIWHCHSIQGEFILRSPNQRPYYGTDYQREQLLLQALRGRDWAIQGQFYSPNEPWLLYRYIPGKMLTAQSFLTTPQLFDELCDILVWTHCQTISLGKNANRDMQDYLKRYLERATFAPSEAKTQAQQWLTRFPKVHCLCLNHHDLTPANLLQTDSGHLAILDWEYAAFSAKGWDEATLLHSFELTDAQHAKLSELSSISQQQLSLYQTACELLDLCWYSQRPLSQAHVTAWQQWQIRLQQ